MRLIYLVQDRASISNLIGNNIMSFPATSSTPQQSASQTSPRTSATSPRVSRPDMTGIRSESESDPVPSPPHGASESETVTPTDRKTCSFCGKTFATQAHTRRHERVHTGERPYPCPQCPKRFNQRGNLNVHIRTHSGARPYSCRFCTKAYASAAYCRLHERSHEGEATPTTSLTSNQNGLCTTIIPHTTMVTAAHPPSSESTTVAHPSMTSQTMPSTSNFNAQMVTAFAQHTQPQTGPVAPVLGTLGHSQPMVIPTHGLHPQTYAQPMLYGITMSPHNIMSPLFGQHQPLGAQAMMSMSMPYPGQSQVVLPQSFSTHSVMTPVSMIRHPTAMPTGMPVAFQTPQQTQYVAHGMVFAPR
eukprot:m.192960 g.192960  ORF g.192960 m.192960 type:complete len:359 (-) comp14872_c0_seq1:392-1468(-)